MLVLLAIAVGAVVGVLVLFGDGDADSQPAQIFRVDAIAAQPTMEPRVHLFNEPVTAGLDLVFDRSTVREGTVQVTTGFAPYTVRSQRVERSVSGDLVRVRYRWRLECTTAPCLPQEGGSSRFDFALGRLDFVVIGQGRSAQPVDWPSIEATARVGPQDVEQAQWRANVSRVPDVSYRVSPGVLGFALLAGAATLLLGAGAIAWTLIPRRSADQAVDAEDERAATGIERALELVLTSTNGSSPDQRRALERLARELGAEGLVVLGDHARRLAWSSPPPTRGEVQALADAVRREMEVEE
jgi:hypothetical protein